MMRERQIGRAAVIAGAGALVTGAVGVYFVFAGRTASRSATELDTAAQAAQTALSGALSSLGRKLEAEASAAAALPQLRNAIEDGVDSYTLQDLFASETWWAPYRERVAAVVSADGAVLATHGENGSALAVPSVLARARRQDTALPAVVAAGGHPYLVAAANLPIGGPKGAVSL